MSVILNCIKLRHKIVEATFRVIFTLQRTNADRRMMHILPSDSLVLTVFRQYKDIFHQSYTLLLKYKGLHGKSWLVHRLCVSDSILPSDAVYRKLDSKSGIFLLFRTLRNIQNINQDTAIYLPASANMMTITTTATIIQTSFVHLIFFQVRGCTFLSDLIAHRTKISVDFCVGRCGTNYTQLQLSSKICRTRNLRTTKIMVF
jgi:hypothetical protein